MEVMLATAMTIVFLLLLGHPAGLAALEATTPGLGPSRAAREAAPEFTYDDDDPHGPLHWGQVCDSIGKQSPLDIPFENLVYDPALRTLLFHNYDANASTLSLLESNNGHTTVITLNSSVHLSVLHGGLRREYFLRQFHFHWGPDDSQGSEHEFDGHKYPLEMHLVHQANGSSIPEQEKLAVVAILFQLSDQNNTHLDNIVANLRSVVHPGASGLLDHLVIADLLPKRRDRYFRYEGSLTTPPCSEQVIWTVMFDTVPISHDQVEQFRLLLDSQDMRLRRNNRPVQKLGNRLIRASFMPVVTSSQVGRTPTLFLAPLLILASLPF